MIAPETEKALIKNLNEEALKMPSQNIYIQTDKDIYELGEDVWFKSYVIDAQTKKLDDSAYVLFVQLLDNTSKEVLVEERFEIQNGIATGHIFIPEEWEEGSYTLMGHTKFSLLNNNAEITSFKALKFKKSIVPKIISHLDFDKNDYQAQDTIRFKLEVYSPRGEPLENARVKISGMQGDRKDKVWRENTDDKGLISLEIVPTSKRLYSSLDVIVNHNDFEERFSYIIPRESNRTLQLGFFPEGGHLVGDMENNLAFKAVDEAGLPIAVQGAIYEGAKSILEFNSEHNGMGVVRFKPRPGMNYTARLNTPGSDSIYVLPDIESKGMVLRAKEIRDNKAHFTLEKSKDFQIRDIYVRAQSRGVVHWLAKGKFDKLKLNFTIPMDRLPQGIAEITVFDGSNNPIVERLIFAHYAQNLNIELANKELAPFRRREKINLKFKVGSYKNEVARPNLGVRIYSERYSDSIHKENIITHQFLKTDIKGKIHHPTYYFKEQDLLRERHLDLLLMTQGWRSYRWNKLNLSKIKKLDVVGSLQEDLYGSFYLPSKEGLLDPGGRTVIQVASTYGIIPITTNIRGAFTLSKGVLKQHQGQTFLVKPSKKGVLKFQNSFDFINKVRAESLFKYTAAKRFLSNQKVKFLDNSFGFDRVNALQEVVLTGYKTKKRNTGNPYNAEFEFKTTDYVCLYQILNCVNHSSGSKPLIGNIYRTNSGQTVTYRAPFPEEIDDSKPSEEFVALRGFYPNKLFYMPNYDEPDEFYVPDYRKTLLWAPLVIPDEEGWVELDFYTSDVLSTYNLEIEGIDENGEMGVFTSKIKVQD
ncbi:hypothetical protein EAX61_03020 [Dokdonia sinensis]|uniref:Macroglobulin domain-containing protein n=1 Tax=Dokdonia sinensis TaxID=2479847 RepID=A0A3M0GGG6_9FLAO|nr:hypothetical protein EAX61_03020 [Dokdonia sinensis]